MATDEINEDWNQPRCWSEPSRYKSATSDNSLHPDTQALFIKVADKIEKNGIEAWFEADIEDFLEIRVNKYYLYQ
jgi:isoleucyl-tRNA synthetase